LEALSELEVIDEVQRQPELFELLRVLVDRPQKKTRFLLLGSASPQFVRAVPESLAGPQLLTRIAIFPWQSKWHR
jgi:predicted AAA+ superfamily ATPase